MSVGPGLHTEHLQLWQQELRDTVAEKSNKDKQDLKDAKKRIKELEKELNRKDLWPKWQRWSHSKKNSITSWRTARTIDPSGE
jgi:hypothetical protein